MLNFIVFFTILIFWNSMFFEPNFLEIFGFEIIHRIEKLANNAHVVWSLLSFDSFLGNSMHRISTESNFQKPIGALFMPKRMSWANLALSLAWVEILRIDDCRVSLWESRHLTGKSVDKWQCIGANFKANTIVEELEGNEVFLPHECVTNLNQHTCHVWSEGISVCLGNRKRKFLAELWKVMFSDEISIDFWNEQMGQRADDESNNAKLRYYKSKASRDKGSEGSVVHMW